MIKNLNIISKYPFHNLLSIYTILDLTIIVYILIFIFIFQIYLISFFIALANILMWIFKAVTLIFSLFESMDIVISVILLIYQIIFHHYFIFLDYSFIWNFVFIKACLWNLMIVWYLICYSFIYSSFPIFIFTFIFKLLYFSFIFLIF